MITLYDIIGSKKNMLDENTLAIYQRFVDAMNYLSKPFSQNESGLIQEVDELVFRRYLSLKEFQDLSAAELTRQCQFIIKKCLAFLKDSFVITKQLQQVLENFILYDAGSFQKKIAVGKKTDCHLQILTPLIWALPGIVLSQFINAFVLAPELAISQARETARALNCSTELSTWIGSEGFVRASYGSYCFPNATVALKICGEYLSASCVAAMNSGCDPFLKSLWISLAVGAIIGMLIGSFQHNIINIASADDRLSHRFGFSSKPPKAEEETSASENSGRYVSYQGDNADSVANSNIGYQ